MCGIFGTASVRAIPGDELEAFREIGWDSLHHRGPDGRGFLANADSTVALGHTRLAILDLSDAAHQPMVDPANGAVLTYNGEVYNYLELRDELPGGKGLPSSGDTVVVLSMLREKGVGALSQFEGMFALALWDERERSLLLARDRMGQKPLYWVFEDGRLTFSSELHSLVRLAGGKRGIDHEALVSYLVHGATTGDRTIYEGVRELPPGHTLSWRPGGEPVIERYWSLPSETVDRDLDEAVEETWSALKEAVRLRLRSDVPTGIFLSGGVDSSLVAAAAVEVGASRISTYTVGTRGEPAYDERAAAREIARALGTEHAEIEIDPDGVVDRIPSLLRSYGEPFADPSGIPTHLVSERARQEVTVVLNGDGGDEVFGGYRRHAAAAWVDRLPPGSGALARFGAPVLGAWTRGDRRSALTRVTRAARLVGADEDTRYLVLTNDSFRPAEVDRLLRRGLDGAWPDVRQREWLESGGTTFDRLLRLDTLYDLPEALLVKADIASMSYALEARSPFLSEGVVRLGASLPPTLRGGARGASKPVLRAIVHRVLGASVAGTPKSGFEVPVDRWLLGPLAAEVRERLLDREFQSALGLNGPVIETTLDARDRGGPEWTRRIWTLYCLAVWWDTIGRASS